MDRWVFPVPGRPEEDDVHRLGEEVGLGEVGDGRALDARLGREVEVVDGLDRREPRALHAGLATVALPRADLLGQHRRQIRLVVPALVAGGLGQAGGDRAHPWRLERPREIRQLRGGARRHAGTSKSRS
jgi:hypothetical protein